MYNSVEKMIEYVDQYLSSELSMGAEDLHITADNSVFAFYGDACEYCSRKQIDINKIKVIKRSDWPEFKAKLLANSNPGKEFDAREEGDKVLLRIAAQQQAVIDFFSKTRNTGINEVYTNLDEEGLYLIKEDAVRNSEAHEAGHKAFITWQRK